MLWPDASLKDTNHEDPIDEYQIQEDPIHENPILEVPILEVYVQPGGSHLVTRPAILRTLLGSCVGIAFWVPRLGVAALCHPMLPSFPLHPRGNMNLAASLRYVDFAVRDIAHQLDVLGARRGEVRVKLFGGANVLLASRSNLARPTVGEQNSEAAIKVLRDEGFGVAASRLGGTSGFNIHFYTGSGEVYLRQLD